MNPPSFIGSSVNEDPENFVEEIQVSLGYGLTNRRRTGLREHHLRAGLVLRRPSWGISSPEN
ncbi:hypothetical protein H5410_003942 [Solanum commersonii]|uniref:Gag-pol polyprotein n=1 Tax=Solanum commersonii TaxID=4109 RepID=A0A9J6B6C8_SOLCO|nr:hypothetical protein H5410_003942 [Solanum commersonii]